MEKLTTEEFIKKAREAHGDRYDYSKVDNEQYATGTGEGHKMSDVRSLMAEGR